MHHISIGRAHHGTPVILLVADLDIRVINTHTGYQRRFKNRKPPNRRFEDSDVLRHHESAPGGT